MDKKVQNEERSFIREHIVPQKNIKKAILRILATGGLALLFGAIAGVAFLYSSRILYANVSPEKSMTQVSVFRDDEPRVTEEAKKEEISPTTTFTAKTLYRKLQNSMLEIIIARSEGDNIFGREIQKSDAGFGIFVAEAGNYAYALFDGTYYRSEDAMATIFNNRQVSYRMMGIDRMTGIGILRVEKSELTDNFTLATLGNSFTVTTADSAFLAGARADSFFSLDEGIVTYSAPAEDVLDGYRELFYTNMRRSEGASGALFNVYGEMVGWVSDYSSGTGTEAVAMGINSLKYLIEDLSSGRDTGYLGIYGRKISQSEASALSLAPGYYVEKAEPGSPVYRSGLEAGDRIISIGGADVSSGQALSKRVDELTADQNVEIMVARRNEGGEDVLNFLIKVGKRKDYNPETR